MDQFDTCIVGAGVVGLAIARELAMGGSDVLLLEQHGAPGQETSSRNSEVIHAGLYYPLGSLKASLCIRGNALLYDYCRRFDIPHRRCGKFVVATDEDAPQLQALAENAYRSGVLNLEWLQGSALRQKEAQVQADLAIFSPDSGIVDSHSLMLSLLQQAQLNGASFVGWTRVQSIEPMGGGFDVTALCGMPDRQESYRFHCRRLINSAGLQAQSVAASIRGIDPSSIPALHLCKGVYFGLRGRSPFSHLIYPLPERQQHGLGVHATLDLNGQVRFGPDTEYVEEPDYKVPESRRSAFAAAIRRYYPALKETDLHADYAGIRPKLQGPGEAFRDFEVIDGAEADMAGLVQLFGIESPGLTAALALAQHVRDILDG